MAKSRKVSLGCMECGKEFRVPPTRAKTARYCSARCADGHRNDKRRVNKEEFRCGRCGKVFYDFPSHRLRRKYCSYRCAALANSKRRNRLCAYCGKVFSVVPSQTDLCCSWECRVARSRSEDWPLRKKVLVQCHECGKEIWRTPSGVVKVKHSYCSRACKVASQKITNKIGSSFYGSWTWYRARKSILERDGHTCQKCGFSGPYLHVHHKEYKRNGGEEADGNLVTLCSRCHMKLHNSAVK